MRKTKVEEYYDKHARTYSSPSFSPDDIEHGLFFADQIMWHFLKQYAPKRKSCLMLEAGAGTGDWAFQFAKLGYRNIVLADISQGMLNEAKRRFTSLGKRVSASFVKSDIVNLKEFRSSTFDFVFSQYDAVSLCLKPRAATRALARVARKGACVVVSLDTKFRRVPELIESGNIEEAMELLETNIAYYDSGHPTYTLTWEELAGYFEQAGLEVLEVIGAEVFTNHVRKKVLDRLKTNPKVRRLLMKMELDHCTNRSLVNMAGHLQMVGEKT